MWYGLARGRSFLARHFDLVWPVALIAASVYFFSGYFTPVRFDRERIEVQAEGGRVRVRGLYHYLNTSRLPAVLTLKVPFPVDRDHPQPEWFALFESAEDGGAGDEIVPFVRGSNVSFRLIFQPQEAKWIRLDYTQPSRVANGRYLLTTTRPWRRPIACADFILRLPRESTLLSSNYPVRAELGDQSWQAFTFSKTDFFPDHDWEFAWDDSRARAALSAGGQP